MSRPRLSPAPTSRPGPRVRGGGVARWWRGGGASRLLFLVPLLVCFGVFAWWPILRSVVLSVQRTNFVTAQWVGPANFARVLADPLLGTATLNTLWFAALALVIGFPLPLLLAVVITEMRRARGLAAVLAYLPVILPPAVATLLWKAFYQPDADGPFNTVLGWFGLGPFGWLNDGALAMPAIVVQATWAGFGTATIVYLAALTAVPTELYEAAECDGAGIVSRLWHITLPQLRGVLLVMLLLQLIATLQVFAEPYIMTGGGPENRTLTLLMLIYRYAFVSGDYGRATALSLMLAVALGVLSAGYLRLTRRWSQS